MGAHPGSQVQLETLVLQQMDLDVQLQVTDQELEEVPEEDTTNRWDTRSPTRQPLVCGKETHHPIK